MFVASFIYSRVLNLFMEIVINNNLNILFTTETISNLSSTVQFFVPNNFLVDTFLGNDARFFQYVCISLGVFIIGLSISIFAFNYFRNISLSNTAKERKDDLKVISLKKILIKKELTILFKDSNNIFSFAGLLLVQPFLLYLVVSALNNVFSSGTFAYYLIALPNFMPVLDIVLIMLFTVIINAGANNFIGAEKRTMRIMKTIPVNVFTQLIIKVSVPFLTSCASLLVSTIILWATKTISFQTFVFGTLITIILLFVFELVSLWEELSIKFDRPKSSFLSSIYSYLLPIAFLVVSLVLSYFSINIVISYLASTGTILLLSLPFVVKFKYRTINKFLDLEVVN